ncbi:unnamed protein product [Citrullus colocynthis]|uniref:Uncharacterized protein n=1 Tax=Citrullus colocynthis TaxID=252529 RepID=A0ABP0XVR5_9ROSI
MSLGWEYCFDELLGTGRLILWIWLIWGEKASYLHVPETTWSERHTRIVLSRSPTVPLHSRILLSRSPTVSLHSRILLSRSPSQTLSLASQLGSIADLLSLSLH